MWAFIRTLSRITTLLMHAPRTTPSPFYDVGPLFQSLITTDRGISWFYSSVSRYGRPRSAPALETVFESLLRDLRLNSLLILVLRPSTSSILSQVHTGWSHMRQHRRTPWRDGAGRTSTPGFRWVTFSPPFIFTLPCILILPSPQKRQDLASLLPNLAQNTAYLQILHRNSSIAHIHASRCHRLLASKELWALKNEANAPVRR